MKIQGVAGLRSASNALPLEQENAPNDLEEAARSSIVARLEWLEQQLLELGHAGLLRQPSGADSTGLVDVASNDYLGYGRRPVSRETLAELADNLAGAGASRLISGTYPSHLELEARLAAWLGVEATLSFSSGYLANVSTICALVGPGDVIFSDELNHASIVDGCRLSRATIRVYPHLDLEALREALRNTSDARRILVVTESYFSMDADSPDLALLSQICGEFGVMLMVDEAHCIGIEGPAGAGLCRAHGVVPDAVVGTFGKAIGTQGAFVGGTEALRRWLWNKARGFAFSTALSPLLAALTAQHVLAIQADDATREHLRGLQRVLQQRLAQGGVTLTSQRSGPIFPIILGTNERALSVAQGLWNSGFRAAPIRPPTVPPGSARLRVSLNARLSVRTVERLAEELIRLCA
jgi:8-amino-7-oxononanoate synthase